MTVNFRQCLYTLSSLDHTMIRSQCRGSLFEAWVGLKQWPSDRNVCA